MQHLWQGSATPLTLLCHFKVVIGLVTLLVRLHLTWDHYVTPLQLEQKPWDLGKIVFLADLVGLSPFIIT